MVGKCVPEDDGFNVNGDPALALQYDMGQLR
jgi:hypothetical protein